MTALHDISAAAQALDPQDAPSARAARVWARAREILSDETQITRAEIDGRKVAFATDMERDPIQKRHRAGAFYEPVELGWIAAHLPGGGTFVDIGANVGNHSLYAGLFCGAGRIIPFEPNPLAYRLLVLNVALNELSEQVVFDFIGVGASDLDEDGFAMSARIKNLGAAKMLRDAGDIATVRPDDVLQDETPGVVKIDVEGMEMSVLRGLQKTIRRCRPVLIVECDRANIHDFADWRLANGFELPASVKHYPENRNFLCIPEERMGEVA